MYFFKEYARIVTTDSDNTRIIRAGKGFFGFLNNIERVERMLYPFTKIVTDCVGDRKVINYFLSKSNTSVCFILITFSDCSVSVQAV